MAAFVQPTLRITVLSVSTLMASTALADGPIGERIIAGFASVDRTDPTTTVIRQTSDQVIAEWDSFDIDLDHQVSIEQPNTDAAILNRITSDNPTQIFGSLTANGLVFLVNPEGILFGSDSIVDVGGLIATTQDLPNEHFLQGQFEFSDARNPSASIINEGLISAQEGGVAALVAPGVRNDGIISARLGTVAAAATTGGFSIDLYGDGLISLNVDETITDEVVDIRSGQPLDALMDNQGTLSASGGTIQLTAAAARHVVDHVINNDGLIEADTVGLSQGRIVLGAATDVASLQHHPEQLVRISGEIRATGDDSDETGGQIEITGEVIEARNARIDASGVAGGGDILFGGGLQGGNPNPVFLEGLNAPNDLPPIPTARSAFVDSHTLFEVSAQQNGNGGNIIAWADEFMEFAGLAHARGGELEGDGGFVEVSSSQTLDFVDAQFDLGAGNGAAGTVLLDPEALYIDEALAGTISSILSSNPMGRLVIADTDHITVAADIRRRRPTTSNGPGFHDLVELNLIANDGITIEDGVSIRSSFGPLTLIMDVDADLETNSYPALEFGPEFQGSYFFFYSAKRTEMRDQILGLAVPDPDSSAEVRAQAERQAQIWNSFASQINGLDNLDIESVWERFRVAGAGPVDAYDEYLNSRFNDRGARFDLNGGEVLLLAQQGNVELAEYLPTIQSVTVHRVCGTPTNCRFRPTFWADGLSDNTIINGIEPFQRPRLDVVRGSLAVYSPNNNNFQNVQIVREIQRVRLDSPFQDISIAELALQAGNRLITFIDGRLTNSFNAAARGAARAGYAIAFFIDLKRVLDRQITPVVNAERDFRNARIRYIESGGDPRFLEELREAEINYWATRHAN